MLTTSSDYQVPSDRNHISSGLLLGIMLIIYVNDICWALQLLCIYFLPCCLCWLLATSLDVQVASEQSLPPSQASSPHHRASCIPCRRSWPNPFSSQNELNMQRGRGATKQEFTNHAMCIIDMPTYALLHSKPSPSHMETHLLWIHDKTVSILHTSPLTCRLNTPHTYLQLYTYIYLHPGTPNNQLNMDVWWKNHFLCKDFI